MDYNEMLFAAQLRDFAVRLRHADAEKHFAQPEQEAIQQAGGEEAEAAQSAWYAENPISAYIPQAFRMIRDVALQIRSLE